jgi:hypothetical protein
MNSINDVEGMIQGGSNTAHLKIAWDYGKVVAEFRA